MTDEELARWLKVGLDASAYFDELDARAEPIGRPRVPPVPVDLPRRRLRRCRFCGREHESVRNKCASCRTREQRARRARQGLA